MAAVLEKLEKPSAKGLALSLALDREGRAEIGPGATVHRPLRDESEPPQAPKGHFLPAELAAIAAAAAPLAAHEERMRAHDDETRGHYREHVNHPHLREAAALQSEALNEEHAKLRGQVRLACLNALGAVSARRAAAYRSSSDIAAHTAAELEGTARYGDNLLGVNTFDPNGGWQRGNALMAPPLALRPRGWATVQDVWGRECYWQADSAGHHDSVRKVQQDIRTELDAALAGAKFPF